MDRWKVTLDTLSTFIYMPFAFYGFSLINCLGLKGQEHDV